MSTTLVKTTRILFSIPNMEEADWRTAGRRISW